MPQAAGSSTPDILEVISDLSNDEVFTPPKVANAVLDLLPLHVWKDPSLRWLDPGCKTGVFLREITKRLMVGLAGVLLDDSERLDHILRNMVYGIAITDLTALLSRRTVYCSKDASGPCSTVQMGTSAGNVWLERVEHSYESDKCTECGASKSQMEKENRENHAYALIHEAGRLALRKDLPMKFDVIVGNPPYQMDSDGGTRTMPLYNLFVEQAKALSPQYIAMIIPSRWMAGGLGLAEFRSAMLQDKRIRTLVDYSDASQVFPGVEIKGGVCYFLWDRDHPGSCQVTVHRGTGSFGPVERKLDEYDVFVRESAGLAILHKVLSQKELPLTDIVATNNEFGFSTNFADFTLVPTEGSVRIHAISGNRRVEGWVERSQVLKGQDRVDAWKVLIPKSYGAGESYPHQILGQPIIAGPPSCSTQTYVFVWTDSEDRAKSIDSYVRTRFFRFLVSLRKISQHAPKPTYAWVPQQSWDEEWTDAKLFEKYGITEAEQAYIAEMVKEMPA